MDSRPHVGRCDPQYRTNFFAFHAVDFPQDKRDRQFIGQCGDATRQRFLEFAVLDQSLGVGVPGGCVFDPMSFSIEMRFAESLLG